MTRHELHDHVVYLRACGRNGLADILEDALCGRPISRRERDRLLVNADYLDRQGYATRGAALRSLLSGVRQ